MTMENLSFSEQDIQKMRVFIDRLFVNPNFANLIETEIEGFLIDFFKQNESQLSSTLATPDFYPNLQWRDIQILYFSVLKNITLEKTIPRMNDLVDRKINFAFLGTYLKDKSIDIEGLRIRFKQFLGRILKTREVREVFDIPCKLIQYDYVEKYVEKIFARRERIYNMLIRQDALFHMSEEEIANYIRVILLLRVIINMRIPIDTANSSKKSVRLNFYDLRDKKSVRAAYEKQLALVLRSEFPRFPESMIRSAIDSHKDCNEETDILSASALLLSIVAKRGRDYAPWITVDKGAEKPDKSWFRVAMKNYQFHGLDRDMLEEFFKIAADESW